MADDKIKRDYSFYSLLADFLDYNKLYNYNLKQITSAINAIDKGKTVYHNFNGAEWSEDWQKVSFISFNLSRNTSHYQINVNENRYISVALHRSWWPFEFIIKD